MSDEPVYAWRVFDLSAEGDLVPPMGTRFWPRQGGGEPWVDGWTTAECHGGCEAPGEDCTCGLRGVLSLEELTTTCTERHFPGSEAPILDDCGVIARVELAGRILPGVDVPNDDTPSTRRAAEARITEIHINGWTHGNLHYDVADRYPSAWVRAWYVGKKSGAWWSQVESLEDAFIRDVTAAGFGTADVESSRDSLLGTMRTIISFISAGDAVRGDATRLLYDSDSHPTWAQANAFIDAGFKWMAPDLTAEPAVYAAKQPPSAVDVVGRTIGNINARIFG